MIARPPSGARIAIIGGGFSGTLVLANLVRESDVPLTIDLFETSGNMATGVAYGTIDIAHLLNVRTDRLGAFPEAPQGFYTWLHDEEGKKQIAKLWPGYEVRNDGYVPRLLYATYLKHVLETTLRLANDKGIAVQVHHATVTDVQAGNPLMLTVEKNGSVKTLLADALVLATGNLPPKAFSFEREVTGTRRYVPNIWDPKWDTTLHAVSKLPSTSHIVVIGTGLTAIDAILTLEEEDYKGTIVAISRHGWLPAAHTAVKPYPAWEWTLHPESAPDRALALLSRLRKEIRSAGASGYDWRSVIDSLRPVTQQIWKRLPREEKRKCLHRLFTLWNIHRHRMAPEVAAEIASLIKENKLKIVKGKMSQVKPAGQSLAVTYHPHGGSEDKTLAAALVINCTGPEYNITQCPNPLLVRMNKRGLITPHFLNLGMEVTAEGTAKGSDAIFPIGTLMVGELLECTAIPELRQQAHTVAGQVVERVKYLRENKWAMHY
jgi:uncharacterized NAD(P)/FAD-binding protein YdhS